LKRSIAARPRKGPDKQIVKWGLPLDVQGSFDDFRPSVRCYDPPGAVLVDPDWRQPKIVDTQKSAYEKYEQNERVMYTPFPDEVAITLYLLRATIIL
jgi:hypothetical protein